MIVVNPNTRQFAVPGSDLVFGVTADSGSEVKYFQCPRYVGNNLDIASSFVRINYRGANGYMDFYLVNDLAIDGDNVTFSWELSPKVTEYKGQVKFVMCVVGPDLKVKWHTTQGTGQVLEGLEPDQNHIEDETTDVVAQLVAMVEAQTSAVEEVGAEQIALVRSAAENYRTDAVEEIEAKRANSLASIPNDYAALSTAVENLVRSTAPGIVCEVEGSSIMVSDASNQSFRGLRIFGRSTQDGVPTPDNPVEIVSVESPTISIAGLNLAKMPDHEARDNNGVIWTASGGVITATGTATSISGNYSRYYLPVIPGAYYVSGRNGSIYVYAAVTDSAGTTIYNHNTSFVLDGTEKQVLIYCQVLTGETVNATAYPMVNIGKTALPWEAYKTIQDISAKYTLRGIPVTTGGNYTDANGQQWICDEVDFERGVYVKRVYTLTLSGSETWLQTERNDIFQTRISLPATSLWGNGYSTHCAVQTVYVNAGKPYFRIPSAGTLLYYEDNAEAYSNNNAWTAFLANQLAAGTPVEIVYGLAKPVETPLSEAELAAYRELHTNKPNTTIINNSGAYMSVEYTADTKLYIDKAIKEALQ